MVSPWLVNSLIPISLGSSRKSSFVGGYNSATSNDLFCTFDHAQYFRFTVLLLENSSF